MGHSLLSFHFVNMNAFVSLVLLAGSSLAAPAADPQVLVAAKPYINTGAASGPLTPAVGDLVATPNGYRSLALEGFSEDLNQDGFVDPIGQAVPVVHTVAAPAVAAVKAVVPAATVKAAPAVAAYSVPVAHHVGYQVHHTVHTCPRSPSRRPSRPTPPTTSSTTPQLSEPSLDSSQLLPQLLLRLNLLRLPQLSRRLRSPVDKNISTTALKFMKLENI